jgi:hypothetical protein
MNPTLTGRSNSTSNPTLTDPFRSLAVVESSFGPDVTPGLPKDAAHTEPSCRRLQYAIRQTLYVQGNKPLLLSTFCFFIPRTWLSENHAPTLGCSAIDRNPRRRQSHRTRDRDRRDGIRGGGSVCRVPRFKSAWQDAYFCRRRWPGLD